MGEDNRTKCPHCGHIQVPFSKQKHVQIISRYMDDDPASARVRERIWESEQKNLYCSSCGKKL